jgi:hypothetical protein
MFPSKFRAGADAWSIAVGNFNADSIPDLAVANANATSVPSVGPPSRVETPPGVSILIGTGTGSFVGPGWPLSGPNYYELGGRPTSVAVGDFNGDSTSDLAVANLGADNVSILLGTGDGTFTGPTNFATGTRPESVAVGDFNGDSRRDLAVGRQSADISILLGNGDGTFAAPNSVAAGQSADVRDHPVAVADFNFDSKADLAAANAAASGVSIVLGNGDGTFTGPTTFAAGSSPDAVAIGDFNGDTYSDVVVGNQSSDNVSILLNTTLSGYARPRSATPMSIRLVPAFRECTTPNGSHSGPLASSSCSPPAQASSFLTLNAPDRPAPYNSSANGAGSVVMKLFCTDGAAPPCLAQPGDQQDLRVDTAISGVRCVGISGGCSVAGGTYAGKLLLTTVLRITDHRNGHALNEPATVTDIPFQLGMECSAGNCNSSTTADAVVSGMTEELERAVWQLSPIQVLDGGSDGNLTGAAPPATGTCPPACTGNGGEAAFLSQGLFAP